MNGPIMCFVTRKLSETADVCMSITERRLKKDGQTGGWLHMCSEKAEASTSLIIFLSQKHSSSVFIVAAAVFMYFYSDHD